MEGMFFVCLFRQKRREGEERRRMSIAEDVIFLFPCQYKIPVFTFVPVIHEILLS